MFPFESVAYAQSAGEASSQSPFFQFIPLVLILGVFWFLIIRPQQKKQQESRKMLDELKEGDQVVTLSGFHGTIKKIKDDTVMLQIADNVRVKINRSSIGNKK